MMVIQTPNKTTIRIHEPNEQQSYRKMWSEPFVDCQYYDPKHRAQHSIPEMGSKNKSILSTKSERKFVNGYMFPWIEIGILCCFGKWENALERDMYCVLPFATVWWMILLLMSMFSKIVFWHSAFYAISFTTRKLSEFRSRTQFEHFLFC